MTAWCEIVKFQISTSSGQQNIPILHNPNDVAYCVFKTVAKNTDNVSNTNRMGIGAMDSNGNGRWMAIRDQDDITTTSADTMWDTGCIGIMNSSNNSVDFSADAVDKSLWIAGNIAISVTNTPSTSWDVFIEIHGGTDYKNVSIGNLTFGGGDATTPLDVGHDLTGLRMICPLSNSLAGETESDAVISEGFFDGTNMACISGTCNDNQNSDSETWRSSSTDFVVRELSGGSGSIAGESTVAFQTDGALFTHSNTYSGDREALYIVWEGPTCKVITAQTNGTAPSDINLNTIGRRPSSLSILSIADGDLDPGPNVQHLWFISGAVDTLGNNFVLGVFSENDESTSDTDRFQSSDDSYMRTDLTGSVTGRAEWKEWNNGEGATLEQTDATGAALVRMFILAIIPLNTKANLTGNFKRTLSGGFQ